MARAARSRSSPGQRPGPARTGVQSGDLLCTTRFSRDCISSLDTGGKEIEQMSRRCARLMMGPTVLPARGARHIRDRAPRVHYHRKLPLRRAQQQRSIEIPARHARNPRYWPKQPPASAASARWHGGRRRTGCKIKLCALSARQLRTRKHALT